MAYVRLDSFRPGIDVEKTPAAQRGGWSVSNLIRWREGIVEALLGWIPICNTAMVGVCRAIHYWTDLTNVSRFAAGTNDKLYLENGGVLTDITPTSSFTPGSASSGGNPYSLLIWSLDNFGQDLIASPTGQGIFVWVPGTPNATLITQAPAFNNGCLVLDQVQIILAWGCNSSSPGSTQDPMLIRWCDQSDFTDWTPSTTNQAGSYRLPHGSRIIGGLQIPGASLLWTDIGVWTVQYIGFPLVFSFFPAGNNCGLIAQKAVAVLGGVVFWMSDHGFFSLAGGGPQQLPCPVWDLVFKNLDHANQDKCLAGSDYHYSEVWFFYPSLNGGTGEIDSYVKVNIDTGSWDYGPATTGSANLFSRTAWVDQNHPGFPVNADLAGLLQQMDTGFTAGGTNPIVGSMIRSGYTDIVEGKKLMTVDHFIPDFLWDGENPSINVKFYFRNWPGDTPTVLGPFTVTPTTEYITLRQAQNITVGTTPVTVYPAVRAREVAIEVDEVNGWFRWGAPRLRVAPAGEV